MYLINISRFHKYDESDKQAKRLVSNTYTPVCDIDLEKYFREIYFKDFKPKQITLYNNKIIIEDDDIYIDIIIFKMVKIRDLEQLKQLVKEEDDGK